ncbi:MAG TPA: hypothetical protein VFX30_14140 [bacterium]|nr:hypothetical protein [bacterium]
MGGSTTSASMPAPVDYTAALGMTSSNNMITALGAQGVQTFGIMESSMNRSEITAANLELGLERLDERKDEARLNYKNDRLAETDRHEEKMAEIEKGDSNTVETTDFLT